MDFDEERDFADQGPLTDMDMEEDAEMLALLLKHMPSCIDADDIEQLVRDILVQPPVETFPCSNPRLPCLYICPVTNVLGRAPLIPCFIGGSSHEPFVLESTFKSLL